MTKKNIRFDWENTFESSAQAFSTKGYDLESLTRAKVEIALTGLLAHEIMSLHKSKIALIGVENPESKNSLRRSNPSTIETDGESNPQYQKPDLLILEKDDSDWNRPQLYAEFKFFYNWDVDKEGKILAQNDNHYILADADKLMKFKLHSETTVCIQGIFFCRNDRQVKYLAKKGGAVDEQKEDFHKGFIKNFEVLLDKERPNTKIISEKVVCLSNATENSIPEFWLDLVLLEISKTKL